MTEAQLTETKKKILEVAMRLFANKGFEGTSIRDIAQEGGFNVAAINYHFISKEKLFLQSMKAVFAETSEHIRQRRAQFPDERVEDLSVWVFEYFLEREYFLRSVFGMLLSEWGHGENMEQVCGIESERFGPPGGEALAEAIIIQLKHDVPEESMFWAVKMIFSNIVHLALMYSNHFSKFNQADRPYHSKPTLKADIRRLVQVVLKDL